MARQQNGIAKQLMWTIVEAVKTMMYNKNLSKTLRTKTLNTVVYTINCIGKTSQEGKTPYELWFNKTPRINHLKIFVSQV